MQRSNFSYRLRTLGGVVLLAGAGFSCTALAADEADLTNRFENVQRLIETSSGAKRVDAGGVAAATARREAARALYADAGKAHAQGDVARAGELLGEASRAMFEAVRLATTPAALAVKRNRDFDDRARSIEALTAALTRIVTEKDATAKVSAVAGEVAALVARGRALRDAGQLDEGRKVLDEAYVQTKRSIEQLRGGQTLVRSLEFASKEEEYAYEVDRNDTHFMLLDVLTRESSSDPAREKMVNGFVERARELREEAGSQAQSGDHAGAVKTLELSTKEYIRAIRSSGIYIPG